MLSSRLFLVLFAVCMCGTRALLVSCVPGAQGVVCKPIELLEDDMVDFAGTNAYLTAAVERALSLAFNMRPVQPSKQVCATVRRVLSVGVWLIRTCACARAGSPPGLRGLSL